MYFFFLLLRTTCKVHIVPTEADIEFLQLHHESSLVQKAKVAVVSIITLSTSVYNCGFVFSITKIESWKLNT